MTMRSGRWVCSNPKCRREVYILILDEGRDGRNPVCSCASEMKKAYNAPRVRPIACLERATGQQGSLHCEGI